MLLKVEQMLKVAQRCRFLETCVDTPTGFERESFLNNIAAVVLCCVSIHVSLLAKVN